ncbi:MAG: acyl-CoA dehydrogenase [Gammaproteobacteria bacterium]|nr:acyl-CoA dehydrogenase [Gammaproteobacteria bacterium]|tara:strand:- start:9738 stop:10928 length:1191 start_codon:yes stop_codon:yes gene_type:complete
MDLSYSPEHESFRNEVRAFLAANGDAAPTGTIYRTQTKEDLAWQKLLIEHGYAARTIPKEYGGYGAETDILKSYIIADEFARQRVRPGHSGDFRLVPTLLELGTEEQKQQYIAPTVSGEMTWCQGYSEPGAGSDLASLSTKAVVDGDDFVINGQKIWTSGAHYADMIFCLVRTEPDAPKHQGISYLLFPMSTPGIEIRPLVNMTGDATFSEVFFTDVRVPTSQIVGARGEGWFVANATLKHERGGLGDPNQAEERFHSILELMKEEKIDGVRLIDQPIYRDRLLKLQARILSMKFNGMRILSSSIKGDDPGLAAWVVKLQGCELNHQMAAMAIDILGEIGILYDDSPHLRDGGFWQYSYMLDLGLIIGGGTAQIQKNMIGERALGLPKEPKPSESV